MIIKGKKGKKKFSGWVVTIILAVILIVLIQYRPNKMQHVQSEQTVSTSTITCGAENVVDGYFIENGHKFSGVATQHQARVRSGNFSSMVSKSEQRGFSYVIEQPIPGKSYMVEVWRNGPEMETGVLAVTGNNPEVFYKETNRELYNDEKWWHKLQLVFTIPTNVQVENITVFVYKKGGDKWIFFDDLTISELESKPIPSSSFKPELLELFVDNEGEQTLREIRERVIKDGVYRKSDDDWIKAKIIQPEKEMVINMRPKGDWPDHVIGIHPSYRIRTKSEESWKGLQNFSIQHPRTRGYILEWLFHELLSSEDILSTKYDFISVIKNNDNPVVYALEGHFDKILLESQNRREGPIIKFTEDHFWDAYYVSRKMRRLSPEGNSGYDSYQSSRILPFKEKKITNTASLNDQFEIAQNLMQQFKDHEKSISLIFDLERMAKYLALAELSIAHHALVWHNLRFYYNPVTSLLEPIGFDAYGNETPEINYHYLFSKKVFQRSYDVYEPMEKLFYHPEFLTKFFFYLNQYSANSWYDIEFSKLDEKIGERENFIQASFPDYTFNKTHLENRVKKVSTELYPYNEIIKAYTYHKSSDSLSILIENMFHYPLEIISIGTKAYEGKANLTNSALVFPQLKGKPSRFDTLVVPSFAEKIFYRLPGTDSIFYSQILPWKKPDSKFPRQELLTANINNNPEFFQKEENKYVVKKGSYVISTPLIIPEGKELFIGPGTQLNFSEEAFIISYSPVNIQGSLENPVVFKGMDDKSGSLTILQSHKKSTISHAVFDGLNTLDYKGWTLTGAVNFYESDVDISNSIFKNNHCEDALNIIRSNFNVVNSSFINTAFDAFDADFCKGIIENSVFNIIGNDGADFSGSKVTINDCLFTEIGDKGISVGENSQVKTNGVEINSAVIGFASKDKSTLEINGAEIKNCQTAFSAYQKKPEFGPATIILGEYKLTDTKREFLIESSSTLTRK